MRRFLVFLVLGASACFAAAPDALTTAALRDARTLIKRMQNFDTEGVAVLLYTDAIRRLGADPAQLKQQAAQLDANLKAIGARYELFTLGVPTTAFVRPEGQFTLIPYTSIMAANGQRVQQDAFFIAVSVDDGKTWKFMDGVATARVPIDTLLPDYKGPPLPQVRRGPAP